MRLVRWEFVPCLEVPETDLRLYGFPGHDVRLLPVNFAGTQEMNKGANPFCMRTALFVCWIKQNGLYPNPFSQRTP